MRELSLFTGAGGGILGTHLLGWTPIGYVEFNDYCQRVLAARIKDGHIQDAPIFGDVRAFVSEGYARRYRGMVDVVTAGFPCQPFSVAGKQAAEDDPRNMWPATAEVLRIIRPRFALLENVPGLLAGSHGYFGEVLRELAALGYDVRWGVLSAADAGGQHERRRLWIVADSDKRAFQHVGERQVESGIERAAAERGKCWIDFLVDDGGDIPPSWRCEGLGIDARPIMRRGPDGMARELDRIAAIGNGQVPAVVRLAWETLEIS